MALDQEAVSSNEATTSKLSLQKAIHTDLGAVQREQTQNPLKRSNSITKSDLASPHASHSSVKRDSLLVTQPNQPTQIPCNAKKHPFHVSSSGPCSQFSQNSHRAPSVRLTADTSCPQSMVANGQHSDCESDTSLQIRRIARPTKKHQ